VKTSKAILSSLLAALMLLSLMPIVYAATPGSVISAGIPDPSNAVNVTVLPGTATVDGDPSEWNYNPADPTDNANYVVTMYTGWDPTKPALADLYMRYDCDNQIMYAFVRTRGDLAVDASLTTTWVAENTASNKLSFIDFAWVYNGSGTVVGWEGSFSLAPNALILVHTSVAGATAGTAQWLNIQASCPPPSAVGLISFTAQNVGRTIVLSWETASELDNLGFNLYRAQSANGPWTQVNADLIPSQVPPGSPVGASYTYKDTVSLRAATYFYRLDSIDVHGHAVSHGPISVSLRPIRISPVRPRLDPGLSGK
jgi:hypothetical protein